MEIQLEEYEKRQKKSLEQQHRLFQEKVFEWRVISDLFALRLRLGIREQDVWLQRLALLNNIPSSKIKTFRFSSTGDIVGGEDEPVASSTYAKVGSKRRGKVSA
jgi:hypothetical protein